MILITLGLALGLAFVSGFIFGAQFMLSRSQNDHHKWFLHYHKRQREVTKRMAASMAADMILCAGCPERLGNQLGRIDKPYVTD